MHHHPRAEAFPFFPDGPTAVKELAAKICGPGRIRPRAAIRATKTWAQGTRTPPVNEAPPKPAMRNAVADWQQKHNIPNDDPIMATVELWEAFLESERIPEGSVTQLRKNVDQLDRICKT